MKYVRYHGRFLQIFFSVLLLYPITAYANSSWHWVTCSPRTILPVAVLLTLLIETFGISKYGRIEKKGKVFIIVTIANIASFILPYVERANRFMAVAGKWSYAWVKAFNSGPYYIVLIGYLVLTLFVEVPIVYFTLKNNTESKKKLFGSIIMMNIATTLAVAILERLFCRGQW